MARIRRDGAVVSTSCCRCAAKFEAAFRCGDLFKRRRRLMTAWSAILCEAPV
jgi:hypothetical protein